VAELRTVESEAASYLDQISRYYITRAKLVSKIVKYPHVVGSAAAGARGPRLLSNAVCCLQEDYRRTITEIDEKEYISLKIIVSELRNQYVSPLGPCAGHTHTHTHVLLLMSACCFQVILHDMILKNIEKIKKPRNSNAEALY